MKQNLMIAFFVLFNIIAGQTFSQSSLYISPGSTLFLNNGSKILINGISLSPTIDYNIPGKENVTRDTVTAPGTTSAHIDRVYHFLSNLPAFTGEITHYYTDAELNGLNENLLNLNLYNGTNWALYPATSRDPLNNFITTSGLTNVIFNEATLAETQLLPVTLTNVKAYQKNRGVQVEWRAEQELNIDKYEVERSQTGFQFTKIGTVTAKGNTGGATNYEFYDQSPINGFNFYRIKVIGQSGELKYSIVMKVNIGTGSSIVTIYPNPVTGNTIGLEISNLPAGIYSITLVNLIGQRISTKMFTHNGILVTETIELPKVLAQGVYQLRVTGAGINISEQIIKR